MPSRHQVIASTKSSAYIARFESLTQRALKVLWQPEAGFSTTADKLFGLKSIMRQRDVTAENKSVDTYNIHLIRNMALAVAVVAGAASLTGVLAGAAFAGAVAAVFLTPVCGMIACVATQATAAAANEKLSQAQKTAGSVIDNGLKLLQQNVTQQTPAVQVRFAAQYAAAFNKTLVNTDTVAVNATPVAKVSAPASAV